MTSSRPRWSDACYNAPINALNVSSRRQLEMRLNIPQDMPNSKGMMADWQGLAELMEYEYLEIQNFQLEKSPTGAVLLAYSKKRGASVGALLDYVHNLERPDVLQDCLPSIERDVETYCKKQSSQPDQVNEISTSCEDAITVSDVETNSITAYHAFISCCGQDLDFVQRLVEELEVNHGLKLCIPERDLLGGTCKFVVTAELIEKRCWRTIIVLSPSYLMSPECDFEIKFAQALNPGSQGKKIVPVMCEKCRVPPILRFITVLDYTKGSAQSEPRWFWSRLAASLKMPPNWTDNENAYRNLGTPLVYPMLRDSYPKSSMNPACMDSLSISSGSTSSASVSSMYANPSQDKEAGKVVDISMVHCGKVQTKEKNTTCGSAKKDNSAEDIDQLHVSSV